MRRWKKILEHSPRYLSCQHPCVSHPAREKRWRKQWDKKKEKYVRKALLAHSFNVLTAWKKENKKKRYIHNLFCAHTFFPFCDTNDKPLYLFIYNKKIRYKDSFRFSSEKNLNKNKKSVISLFYLSYYTLLYPLSSIISKIGNSAIFFVSGV